MTESIDQGAKKTGPPPGFGTGVNNYLNHYVNVADAKAAGLLTADFALGGFLINKPPVVSLLLTFHWIAMALLIVSAIAAILVLYPRTPKVGSSLIFWDDVCSRPSLDAYFDELRFVDQPEAERQYAAQNYFVSIVLSAKYSRVRLSMRTLMGAIPVALLRIILA